ncbi:MAG TPA: UDP-N-acetylglucosamine--N-acetylmuramyl-(pentapeptide) pyrophosphoryl-undecaprenol N-acetylglucosamine transferase [Candidatus Omnitrophota bacterium]|nr:UDP-N-acetylglucosamine--N-acetylmuramyl-(pentapeptide) pyrophosphoryl-undecaprenol N-acetylglucosamine transferase [Candidatus Omnitrophota bacterium]HRZ15252.1 UDP-N-acetylglucosamine--N-acetylmuramyl-(pentapeptide) pyrophosphoryl-undecaprenol N-acetylglucosamine transferase [Candidatus Omnitrophota bacterium]
MRKRLETMKILAVSGASGGHIFPAAALLERVTEDDPRAVTLLVLPRKHAACKSGAFAVPVSYVCLSNISASLTASNLLRILRSFKGLLQSLRVVARFHPDVVVGFGSLVSIPVVFWGWLLRCRIVLHEQNVVPGRATRFLARFADRIAVTFAQTVPLLGAYRDKAAVTGNPLRKRMRVIDRDQARAFFGLPAEGATLLVMGGSQGSQSINTGAAKALAGCAQSVRFQVIHLAGDKDAPAVEEVYRAAGIRFRVVRFLEEMEYAYSASDLAISRSGATTVTELCRFRLPAILVPYPFAGAHQQANARVLADAGAARVIEDSRIGEELAGILKECIGDRTVMERMRRGFDHCPSADSAEALMRVVYETV